MDTRNIAVAFIDQVEAVVLDIIEQQDSNDLAVRVKKAAQNISDPFIKLVLYYGWSQANLKMLLRKEAEA